MEFRLRTSPDWLLFLLIIVQLPWALSLPTFSSCATNDRNGGWTKPDWSHQRYVSTESVVKANIGTVCPPIDEDRVPIRSIEDYLTVSGPLGYLGPLGPEGPLGILGPIGTDVLHPSDWISGILNWHPWAHVYTTHGGPLSAEGPLGYRGPTAPNQYYGFSDPGRKLFSTNDFAVQMHAFGLFNMLGPVGPLGDMGPFGPLGPLGAHGLVTDEDGNYMNDDEKLVRTISVQFNATMNLTFELYEFYTTQSAKCANPPDTSFMARGELGALDEVDYFPLRSASDQLVSVALTPIYNLDEFDLALYDARGHLVAASEARGFVNTLQVMMRAGQTLYAAVKLRVSEHFAPSLYRVSVTGGSDRLTNLNAAGNHILNIEGSQLSESSFASIVHKFKIKC